MRSNTSSPIVSFRISQELAQQLIQCMREMDRGPELKISFSTNEDHVPVWLLTGPEDLGLSLIMEWQEGNHD
jgi:hypothetical protein